MGQIDPDNVRAPLSHGLTEYSAAAPNIQHAGTLERGPRVDIVQSQRVDLVERFQRAVRVPPLIGQRLELGKFLGIACVLIFDGLVHEAVILSAHSSAFWRMAATSMRANLRSSRRCSPATHTSVTFSRPAA